MTTVVPGRRPTLGVLGGMGPSATAEFLRVLASRSPATTDQDHPRIVLLSDPSVPDRTTALLAGDDGPLLPIRNGLLTLASWGADLLAVPCNTAHAYVDRIVASQVLAVPVVHIVDAALQAARRVSPRGAWLTATTGTVSCSLYQRRAAAVGYRLRVPDAALQLRIHAAVTLVKAGRTVDSGRVLAPVVRQLWHRDRQPVLAACTELPIAYAAARLPPELMISSLDALADACVAELYRVNGPVDLATAS